MMTMMILDEDDNDDKDDVDDDAEDSSIIRMTLVI